MQISYFLVIIVLLEAGNIVLAVPTFDKIAEVLADMLDPSEYNRPRPPPEKYNYPSRPIYPSAQHYPSNQHYTPSQHYPPNQYYQPGQHYSSSQYYPPSQNYPTGYESGPNYGGYYQQSMSPGGPPPYPNNYYGPQNYGATNYGNRPGYTTYGY